MGINKKKFEEERYLEIEFLQCNEEEFWHERILYLEGYNETKGGYRNRQGCEDKNGVSSKVCPTRKK